MDPITAGTIIRWVNLMDPGISPNLSDVQITRANSEAVQPVTEELECGLYQLKLLDDGIVPHDHPLEAGEYAYVYPSGLLFELCLPIC